MPIMIDLNVILDVMQKREPHYHASAGVLNRIVTGEFRAYLPGHALTTLHYVLTKHDSKQKANETIDWLLQYFEVAGEDKAVFLQARILSLSDFEDAVVASTAKGMRMSVYYYPQCGGFQRGARGRNNPRRIPGNETCLIKMDTGG